MINLEAKVKEQMARQKLTLRDLAECMSELRGEDISIQRVSAMIKSENPQARTLGHLADALRVDVSYFFTE